MKVSRFALVTLIILVLSVYCSSQDLPQSIEKCTAIHKSIYDNATTIFTQVETLDDESTSKQIIYIEKHARSKTGNIKKDFKRYNRFLKKFKNKSISLRKDHDNIDSNLTHCINDYNNILDNCIVIYSEANDYFFEGLETLSYCVEDASYLETCKRSFSRLIHSLEYLKKELKYLQKSIERIT